MTAAGELLAGVRVRAPGKINLALAVGDLRPDGYHDLATVFHAVDLYDELVLRPAPAWRVKVPDCAGVPETGKNLAVLAGRALQKELAADPEAGTWPVSITIAKQIPVAGGMAGGSADAAAALVGCNALWEAGFDRDELASVGVSIGSDVPFAVHGGTAVGAGRGELLSPVLTRMTLHWVLALSGAGLSTKDVYAELDRIRAAGRAGAGRIDGVEPVVAALRSGSVSDVAAALGNDLQAAAISLQPELRRTVRAGLDAGALAAIVSGSGPTVAMLCADADHAGEVAAEVAGSGTCRSVRTAVGPVPGARVVGGAS